MRSSTVSWNGVGIGRGRFLLEGGTAASADQRPIVLLTVVYRLWAAMRAGCWRPRLRAAGAVGSGAMAAAEYKACVLGFDLDVVGDEPACGGGSTPMSRRAALC